MWVWPLGWEDPLEEEVAPHSSILTWRIPWTEEPGGLQYVGSQRVRHDQTIEHTHMHTYDRANNKLTEGKDGIATRPYLHFLAQG